MAPRTFHGRATLGQGLDREVSICTTEQVVRTSAYLLDLPNRSEAHRRRRTV